MTYEEFKLKLKTRLQRTKPDAVGHWTRYLEQACPDLDEFITNLCFLFLKGGVDPLRDYPQFINDLDVVWYFETFIQRQANAIQSKRDNEPLVLALAAIAIIGHRSDPRDLTIWIDDVYYAAKNAGVPEPQKYFGETADLVVNQRDYVAKRMRTYPALIERLEEEKAKGIRGS